MLVFVRIRLLRLSSCNANSFAGSVAHGRAPASKLISFFSSDATRAPSDDKDDAFTKNHGFGDTQISNLVQKEPSVLLADPEKTLIPKIQLLASLGASPAVFAKIIENSPTILRMSLDRKLVPSLLYLKVKDLLGTDEKVVQALLHYAWLLSRTIISITKNSKETWEKKCETFRKWGWSDTELSNAFTEGPQFISFSQKKIDEVMDLMVNTMGFSPSSVAERPWIIYCSVKKLTARCSVIQILEVNGVIKRADYTISALTTGESQFLKRFVTRHKDILPELLDVYCKALKDGKLFQVCHPIRAA
ncbi:hypothetical protein QQ045_005242 [Rhodiola kirilowii]